MTDLTPPDVVAFLKRYRDRPRTFSLYRAQIGELMRIGALRRLMAERHLKRPSGKRVETPILFTRASGRPLTYSAVACAWQDGARRWKACSSCSATSARGL